MFVYVNYIRKNNGSVKELCFIGFDYHVYHWECWIIWLGINSQRVPYKVADWFVTISDSPVIFLLLVNVILLVVGMFLETGAAIVIMAPILTPVAVMFGIDPVHFGIIMIVNLAVGMVTPPIGVNLFVASQIAGLRIEHILKPMIPFYIVLLINIVIISTCHKYHYGYLTY